MQRQLVLANCFTQVFVYQYLIVVGHLFNLKSFLSIFQCEIKATPDEDPMNLKECSNFSEFSFKGPVNDVEKSTADIKKSGFFLHLYDTQIQQMKMRTPYFGISVSISSLQIRDGVKIVAPIEPKPASLQNENKITLNLPNSPSLQNNNSSDLAKTFSAYKCQD